MALFARRVGRAGATIVNRARAISAITTQAPEAIPLPHWRPLNAFHYFPPKKVHGHQFIHDGNAIRVKYYMTEDGTLAARAWFGPRCEGPPGHCHGGSMLAVLDEAMGAAAWIAGGSARPVLAKSATGNFSAPLPLGTDTVLLSWVVGEDGDRVSTAAQLADPDTGDVFAEGSGLFVRLDPAVHQGASRMMAQWDEKYGKPAGDGGGDDAAA